MSGSVNLPEVILYAEPEKDNSKLLIMNATLTLGFKSKNQATSLEINMEKIGMRLGEFNNQKLGIPFLSDCSGKITMRQMSPKQPALYVAEFPLLSLNMTPTLYEVVMGVINTLNKSGTEKVQKETEIKKLLEDAEPFIKHKIDKNQYVLNGSKDESLIQELDDVNITVNQQSALVIKKKVQKVIESLDLKLDEACITFCEETGLDLQPLAIVKFGLRGCVSNWTKKLHLKGRLTLEASYYNDRLSNWEPLVENFLVREDLYRPWNLNIWFVLENGGVLQPPSDNKGIESIEFPIKNLDYSTLNATTRYIYIIMDL